MRCATLLLLVVLLPIAAATAQQSVNHAPQNGADVLEVCGKAVSWLDSPGTQDSDDLRFMKASWCLGYMEGLRESLTYLRFAMNKGVHDGPLGPNGLCLPEEASPGQLARVFVKWLRDHPESLHEPVQVIWVKVLASAFPCDAPRVSENNGGTVPKLISPAETKGKDAYAPLPARLVTAHKVFVLNRTGVPEAADQAYKGLKAWGRFTITETREEADLILVLTTTETESSVALRNLFGTVYADPVKNGYTTLLIFDAKEPDGAAIWQISRQWSHSGSTKDCIKELRKRLEPYQ